MSQPETLRCKACDGPVVLRMAVASIGLGCMCHADVVVDSLGTCDKSATSCKEVLSEVLTQNQPVGILWHASSPRSVTTLCYTVPPLSEYCTPYSAKFKSKT